MPLAALFGFLLVKRHHYILRIRQSVAKGVGNKYTYLQITYESAKNVKSYLPHVLLNDRDQFVTFRRSKVR